MREILLQLKSQADEIASLKANSNTYAMKSDVVELERKMDVRFSALEKRVEQLERETAVDSSLTLDEKLLSNSSERIPIARFIRAHDSRLEKTTRLIAETLATRSELESIRSLAAEQLNDAVTKLCDEMEGD